MRVKEFLRFVSGSLAVYVAMAAYSAPRGPLAFTSHGRTRTTAGHSSGAASSQASFPDTLRDPVAQARADPNQSGSRLKAKYYLGADGSKMFAGLYDSVLNFDCAFDELYFGDFIFGPAPDGTIRCLPPDEATSFLPTRLARSH
jgi:hypothetical protein